MDLSGQGRPLGHLMAWLLYLSAGGKRHRKRVFPRSERVRGRRELHLLADSDLLFKEEAGADEVEGMPQPPDDSSDETVTDASCSEPLVSV